MSFAVDRAIADFFQQPDRAHARARALRTVGMAYDEMLFPARRRRRDLVAMDRTASARTYSMDGHLSVKDCVLTRAAVNDYMGSEIPDSEELGLDPNTRYPLFRPPDELRKAAPSMAGKPILGEHTPINSHDHPADLVIGSVGTDVRYEHPFVKGSLTFWTQPAIDAIENGEMKELSAGYHYVPVPEEGVYEGKPYKLRMTDIAFNHLALVPEGRVGPIAFVADALPPTLYDDHWAAIARALQARRR